MSQHFERVLLLTKVPLFTYLRTDQLNKLAPLLEPVAWPQGDRVFDMGDIGLEMYIITTGHIGVSVDPNPDLDPTQCAFINELRAGDILGEMALIDNEQLRGLLMSYPELGIGMLRALSQRLRLMSPALAKREK